LWFVVREPASRGRRHLGSRKTGQHRGQRTIDTTGRFSRAKVASYAAVLPKLFSDSPPRGSWLDIGCGHGEFLVALKAFCGEQLIARGTEPNPTGPLNLLQGRRTKYQRRQPPLPMGGRTWIFLLELMRGVSCPTGPRVRHRIVGRSPNVKHRRILRQTLPPTQSSRIVSHGLRLNSRHSKKTESAE